MMVVDWNRVKKETLWSYEDLIKKMMMVLAYPFVLEHYNHTMKQAQYFAREIQRGYLQNKSDATLVDSKVASFERLEDLQVKSYLDLIQHIETRGKCEAFLRQTGFDFDQLIQTLNYMFRMVLPFAIPVRELINKDNEAEKVCLESLKQHSLRSNLDILEKGRTSTGRTGLSKVTGIPKALITALVHGADISRLAYVRGKTVLHLCKGGYDTLDKIADADLLKMEKEMDAYYRTLGKSLADFKSVIPLSWMIGGAQILPKVVAN